MKLKSVELDLTALMSEVMFGHGYAHYGYFPNGAPDVLSAAALGEAQHAYFERLEQALPFPVWFVLGNHDFYYGGITATRKAVTALSKQANI